MTAKLPQFLMALCALPLLAVSACSPSTKITPTTFVNYQIPAPLLTCSGEPARLTGEFTQRDVAVYVVKLRAAYADCAGNLASVNEIVSKTEQELLARASK